MIGAIAGDMVGSVYEFDNIRTKDFPLFTANTSFTDDTVLTVALADALLTGTDYGERLRHWYRRYPGESYGGRFRQWAASGETAPYHSWGNGAAMRVSPAGFAFDDLDTVLERAAWSASPTHDHPEGIKGAQATAACIFLARQGASKADIRDYVTATFGYALDESLNAIRRRYRFDESCQGTVPQAVTAFLEAGDFEETLRNAVSIGGDSDTMAAIAGGIAEAFFAVPAWIEAEVMPRLADDLKTVTQQFRARFMGVQDGREGSSQ
jgi:ADP-ribosylglycohydrolase